MPGIMHRFFVKPRDMMRITANPCVIIPAEMIGFLKYGILVTIGFSAFFKQLQSKNIGVV